MEQPMRERKMTISPKVDRKVYFLFRDLCHSHGMLVELGIEEVLRVALQRAGVPVDAVQENEVNKLLGTPSRPASISQ